MRKEFGVRLYNLARELLITLPWSHNQLDDDGGDMGRCDTPKESIANLLHVKQKHFPGIICSLSSQNLYASLIME